MGKDWRYAQVVKRKINMGKELKFYLDELLSDQCACGMRKQPLHSFCYRCYMSLPGDMRRDLWQAMGDGYEAAYEEAVKWLER